MLLKLPALRITESSMLDKKPYKQNLLFFYLILPDEKVDNILARSIKPLIAVITKLILVFSIQNCLRIFTLPIYANIIKCKSYLLVLMPSKYLFDQVHYSKLY